MSYALCTWFVEEERSNRWGPPASESEKERGRYIGGAFSKIMRNKYNLT
jgi:hypothetical protein